MTASRGIGKGNNSGGKNPGAGRPKGALNRRATALIAEAEREGLLMPVDYLLGVMRDPDAAPRDRISAAAIAAPFCHPRLTVMQTFPDPANLDDVALMIHTARLERHLAAVPESERVTSVNSQVEHMLEDIPQLPAKRQAALFRKLAEIGEAGLQRLNDPERPGAVIRRPMPAAGAPVQPSDRAEASTYKAPAYVSPHAPAPAPEALDESSLRYNPVTRKLERV